MGVWHKKGIMIRMGSWSHTLMCEANLTHSDSSRHTYLTYKHDQMFQYDFIVILKTKKQCYEA